jgi:hypothetical protein
MHCLPMDDTASTIVNKGILASASHFTTEGVKMNCEVVKRVQHALAVRGGCVFENTCERQNRCARNSDIMREKGLEEPRAHET